MLEYWQLRQRQGLPLEVKEALSLKRIREWYDHWNGQVYVSFSGGKDSTVLLDLVRREYPDVPAVFVDTGLEYPEIREFVKTVENVVWLKPKMPFPEVIKKYGYPVVSKETAQRIWERKRTRSQKMVELFEKKMPQRWKFLLYAPFAISDRCCKVMKKSPTDAYAKESGRKRMTGMMAGEGRRRLTNYLRHGCNSFDGRPMSTPIAFWTEADVWAYIRKYKTKYSTIYDMGYERTGCMFCMFGVHMEKGENRFQRMERTHPQLHKYCMEKLGLKRVLDYIGVPSTMAQMELFNRAGKE